MLLPPSNWQLVSACENVLVKAHTELLQEEFQRLLDQDKEEDLNRMYNLLHRIDNGLDPLRVRFEEHVKRVGTSNVEKIVTAEKEVVSGASPLVILGGAALILVCAPRNRKRTSRRSSRSTRRMPSSCRGPSGATRPSARRWTR